MTTKLLHTPLCDRLGIVYPIWLAGMGSQGRATPPALVAAVSEFGGLGCIGGSNLAPDELRRVIREVRRLTSKPIGVHLIVPQKGAAAPRNRGELRRELFERYPRHVQALQELMTRFGLAAVALGDDIPVSQAATADGGTGAPRGTPEEVLQEQLDVVFSEDVQVIGGAMGPIQALCQRAKPREVPVLALATSVTQAQRYRAEGADIVVAQGAEAGGHVGRVGTFALLPQMIDSVPLPVLAAGGISDGRGLAASLAFGAAGVWVGTAFLVANECGIADVQKQQIIDARSEDFTSNRIFSGSPMRAFRNALIRAWEELGLETLPSPWQKVLMDDFNAAAAAAGRWDLHSNPAGEGAGSLRSIRPAAEIMRSMVGEAVDVLERLRGRSS